MKTKQKDVEGSTIKIRAKYEIEIVIECSRCKVNNTEKNHLSNSINSERIRKMAEFRRHMRRGD